MIGFNEPDDAVYSAYSNLVSSNCKRFPLLGRYTSAKGATLRVDDATYKDNGAAVSQDDEEEYDTRAITVRATDARGQRIFTRAEWVRSSYQPALSHVNGHSIRESAMLLGPTKILKMGLKKWAEANNPDAHHVFINAYAALGLEEHNIPLSSVPELCRRVATDIASCRATHEQESLRQVYFEDLVSFCADCTRLHD